MKQNDWNNIHPGAIMLVCFFVYAVLMTMTMLGPAIGESDIRFVTDGAVTDGSIVVRSTKNLNSTYLVERFEYQYVVGPEGFYRESGRHWVFRRNPSGFPVVDFLEDGDLRYIVLWTLEGKEMITTLATDIETREAYVDAWVRAEGLSPPSYYMWEWSAGISENWQTEGHLVYYS